MRPLHVTECWKAAARSWSAEAERQRARAEAAERDRDEWRAACEQLRATDDGALEVIGARLDAAERDVEAARAIIEALLHAVTYGRVREARVLAERWMRAVASRKAA